ncbi:36977_t:CDS:2, partial [Gigaspora margarita]
YSYKLKELLKLKLTSSIKSNLKQIMKAIHIRFRRRPVKKYKLENANIENLFSISSSIKKKIKKKFLVNSRIEIVNSIKEFFNIELEEKNYIITNYKADKFNLEEFGITFKNVTIGKMYDKFKKISKKLTKLIEEAINVVPKVLTITRAIRSEKTTKAKHLEKYLKKEGYKVYRMTKVLMQVSEVLKTFYKTKNAIFFQQVIINKYKQVIDEINEMNDYDYIIIDHGFKKIKIFTEINIKDKKIKDYLKKTT